MMIPIMLRCALSVTMPTWNQGAISDLSCFLLFPLRVCVCACEPACTESLSVSHECTLYIKGIVPLRFFYLLWGSWQYLTLRYKHHTRVVYNIDYTQMCFYYKSQIWFPIEKGKAYRYGHMAVVEEYVKNSDISVNCLVKFANNVNFLAVDCHQGCSKLDII